MKKYISFFLSVLLIVSLLLSPILPSLGFTKLAEASTIAIKAKQTTLEVGSATTLTVSGTKKKVTWSSSNKSYVKVDSKGKISAVKIGSATITASVSGKKLKCKITVVECSELSCSSLTLNVGKKDFLKVNGKNTGKVKVANWSSANPKVAYVDKSGNITGKSIGTTVITASIYGKKYTCKVRVNEKIDLIDKKLTLEQGKTKALAFKGITYRAVWSSDNKDIAYVSFDGKVTAVGVGTTNIIGNVDGTDYKCIVTVTKVASDIQSSALVAVGEKKTLTLPDNMKGTVQWSSNNQKITVSNAGVVAVKTVGNAIITASAGSTKYKFFVVGVDQSNPYIKKAPFATHEVTTGNMHFVLPNSWDVKDLSYESECDILLHPDQNSDTEGELYAYKSYTKSPDYYTAKLEMVTSMSKENILNNYKEENADYGVDYSVISFKQGNYMTSYGNVLKTEFKYTLFGQVYREIMYNIVIDGYKFFISLEDTGDVAGLQETIEYIVNSIYIQK